ncbi:MAG: hypothetical protein ABIN18_15100 [Pseudomonadota bacterium]|nr:hypothetical protein [Acidobacteriota bacterium]
MSATFSRKYGYGQCAKELIYEDVSNKFRIGLWNLIQDYVRQNNLIGFDDLYLNLTTFFRLKREHNVKHYHEIEHLVLISLNWNELYDLIQHLFTLVVSYDYDEEDECWKFFPERVGNIRYSFTVEINKLLDAENIGWRLKKGMLEREGSEYLDKETIEKTKKVLGHPDYIGPNYQFLKAIDFFNKRPKPDLENCIKEAVGALEGVVRILMNDNNITLGKAVDKLIATGKMRKPFDKVFHVLYGFASSEPGPRHGAFELSKIDIGETEFVLYNSAACMLFLCKKFGFKSEEEEISDQLLDDEDIPS